MGEDKGCLGPQHLSQRYGVHLPSDALSVNPDKVFCYVFGLSYTLIRQYGCRYRYV
jgi:hypothetical protein